MLLIGREIRELMRNNRAMKFTFWTKSGNFREYADHVGFFRYCGIDRGKSMGEAFGSANYIPITLLDLNELRMASGDRPYAEIMEEKAAELTRILIQVDSGELYDVIQYSLRELLRNAIEHSRAAVLIMFGQYWPVTGQAEIALYDTGVGIATTLLEAGVPSTLSAGEILQEALKPGVTSVSATERSYQHAHYRNSGFGLYVTSQFFSKFGLFRVMSGNATVTINATGITTNNWSFRGTCVHLSFNTKSMEGSRDLIHRIIKEGEKVSIGGHTASSSSKTIRVS